MMKNPGTVVWFYVFERQKGAQIIVYVLSTKKNLWRKTEGTDQLLWYSVVTLNEKYNHKGEKREIFVYILLYYLDFLI